jgi:hypothetical protein
MPGIYSDPLQEVATMRRPQSVRPLGSTALCALAMVTVSVFAPGPLVAQEEASFSADVAPISTADIKVVVEAGSSQGGR